MQNVVADNSRDQYDTRAVGLVLWLYKDPLYRSLLLPELLEDLDKIMDGDGGGNKNLRSTIKVAIKGMNRHDNNSCSIKLENLTFNCFTEYLLSLRPKKKKKKRRKRKRTGVVNEAESGGESELSIGLESERKKYLGKSMYGSSRSALMHLYRGCGAKMSDTF